MKSDNNQDYTKIDFKSVMNRLKETVDISTDRDLARYLGLSQATYSERKKRNSIPYDAIFEKSFIANYDIQYLILGKHKSGTTNINYTANENKGNLVQNGSITVNSGQYSDKDDLIEIIELLKYADKPVLDKIKSNLTKLKEAKELF